MRAHEVGRQRAVHRTPRGLIKMERRPRAEPDAAADPVAIKPEPRAARPRRAEVETRGQIVHDRRIVVGHVDHLGIGRHDAYVLGLEDHGLLRRACEVAGRFRLRAEALHGGHHVVLLIEKSDAELLRPREVFVHPAQHVGITREGAHAFVPRLLVDLRRVASVLEETRREHDVRRIRGCGKNNAEERVGIERDRGDEFFDIRRGVFHSFGRIVGCGDHRAHTAESQKNEEYIWRFHGEVGFKLCMTRLRRREKDTLNLQLLDTKMRQRGGNRKRAERRAMEVR